MNANSSVFIPPSRTISRPLSPSIPPYYPPQYYQPQFQDVYYTHHYQTQPIDVPQEQKKKRKKKPKNVFAKPIEEIEQVISTKKPSKKPKSYAQVISNPMPPVESKPQIVNDKKKPEKKQISLGDLVGKNIREMKKKKTILNVIPKSKKYGIKPMRPRGKVRVVPKKKRLSKLKRIIINDRERQEAEKEWITEDEREATIEESKRIPKEQIKKREYVTQELDLNIDKVVKQMLEKLDKFQKRLKKNEPLKFKMKRRYVVGLREVIRGMKSKKIIAVVMAPNIEKIETPGGLDTVVQTIIDLGKEKEIPIIYALSKRLIGKALGKQVKMSAVGIYSADGAFDEFKEALRLTKEASMQKEQTK